MAAVHPIMRAVRAETESSYEKLMVTFLIRLTQEAQWFTLDVQDKRRNESRIATEERISIILNVSKAEH